MPKLRGVRGAIQVEQNNSESILASTGQLLMKIVDENDIDMEDIASIFFTVTDDLDAEFPAYAARKIGMSSVPLMCSREMAVPGSMNRLIRILILVNTDKGQKEIKHQYLGKARHLRPDLPNGGGNDDSSNED